MAKFSERFFCPAPWTHIYYQLDSPSPCHVIRNHQLNMTPQEYVNSDWLKSIKTDMIEGRVPSSCNSCKKKEDLGLKSTRGTIWKYYNVGPEPNYEDQWFYNKFTVDTPTLPQRIELRFSNLCNMKCRMCDETSSSLIAQEKNENGIPPSFSYNPGNAFKTNITPLLNISDDKVEGLKDKELLGKLQKVCFTGGEPLLIKKYYEYLDFLIDEELNTNLDIELFTNNSVYNPLFIDRLKKFRNVELVMSIDGVGKTAEYIRHGTRWPIVEKNILKFNSLGNPIQAQVTVAISTYVLLDVAALATFLMQLYEQNNSILIKCYTVLMPWLTYLNAPTHLRLKMVEQINAALEILSSPNYEVFANELRGIRHNLLTDPVGSPTLLYRFTENYDKIRSESFEDTFNISLRPTS